MFHEQVKQIIFGLGFMVLFIFILYFNIYMHLYLKPHESKENINTSLVPKTSERYPRLKSKSFLTKCDEAALTM
jgi:hypothetical protein